jgi:hypothetical protein
VTPKIVYDKEWVKTCMTSKQFSCTGYCTVCNRMTAGWMWHSIKSGESVCGDCFTPRDA